MAWSLRLIVPESKVEEFYPSMQQQQKMQMDGSFVVLLATCDQQISEELNLAFANRKIEFLTFTTARDIILAMAERKIDLMIIDPEVTALQGLEILPVLKKLRPQARIIAMSEDLSFEMRAALVKEGVLYQIQTPINAGQISQLLETVIEKLHPVESKLLCVV